MEAGSIWQNWAGTQQCNPHGRAFPSSTSEVSERLVAASASKRGVRVVGAGHSWTDAVCTDGLLLSLDRMCRVLEVDLQARTVRVQAGIRLNAMTHELRVRGLAFSNLGSVLDQSIAGAITTGTHGSGLGFGNLASQITALTLVAPDGQVRELSNTQDAELFRAAKVSLGALGVITEVTVQCEPDFNLSERRWVRTFDQALDELPTLVRANEHIKFWWLPHTDRVWICCLNRTDGPIAPTRPNERSDRLQEGLYKRLLSFGRRFPNRIPGINRFISRTQFKAVDRVGWGADLFTVPVVPRHDETEYAIDWEQTPTALRWLRNQISAESFKVNFIVEVRFVAADDAMMSPCYDQASCHLGAYLYQTSQRDDYFRSFEYRMQQFGGRPHWGKSFFWTANYLRRVLPEYDRFNRIRGALDPNGMMANDFVRRVFGDPQ